MPGVHRLRPAPALGAAAPVPDRGTPGLDDQGPVGRGSRRSLHRTVTGAPVAGRPGQRARQPVGAQRLGVVGQGQAPASTGTPAQRVDEGPVDGGRASRHGSPSRPSPSPSPHLQPVLADADASPSATISRPARCLPASTQLVRERADRPAGEAQHGRGRVVGRPAGATRRRPTPRAPPSTSPTSTRTRSSTCAACSTTWPPDRARVGPPRHRRGPCPATTRVTSRTGAPGQQPRGRAGRAPAHRQWWPTPVSTPAAADGRRPPAPRSPGRRPAASPRTAAARRGERGRSGSPCANGGTQT